MIYTYHPPSGPETELGHVLFSCPIHPKNRIVWDARRQKKWLEWERRRLACTWCHPSPPLADFEPHARQNHSSGHSLLCPAPLPSTTNTFPAQPEIPPKPPLSFTTEHK